MVVSPHPLGGVISNFIKIAPMVLRQPFITNGPIEAFDIGILCRLARLDIFQSDAFGTSPVLQRCTDVFRAVVAANDLGFATPLHDLLQHPNYTLRGQ